MLQINPKSLLKLCVIFIFLGRAYQYLFYNAPFRALLWDENLLKPLVEQMFNTNWNAYVTDLSIDKYIQASIKTNGLLYLVAAICTAFIDKSNARYLKYPIMIGGFLLALLSFLTLKERFFQYGQFFEHAIQVGIPFLLLHVIRKDGFTFQIKFILKVLIGLTFISHGLYAFGYYPIPGHFIDMTINGLGVSENMAIAILKTAGILDFAISILIFLPRTYKYALWYAFIWGILTAFARIVAGFNADFIFASLHQTVYLTLYRLPHGLIPLLLLILAASVKKKDKTKPSLLIKTQLS